jgi:hypothetical protein
LTELTPALIVDVAAAVAFAGMDPMRFLETSNAFEQLVMIEVAQRAMKLREDYAKLQANLIAEALSGGR